MAVPEYAGNLPPGVKACCKIRRQAYGFQREWRDCDAQEQESHSHVRSIFFVRPLHNRLQTLIEKNQLLLSCFLTQRREVSKVRFFLRLSASIQPRSRGKWHDTEKRFKILHQVVKSCNYFRY